MIGRLFSFRGRLGRVAFGLIAVAVSAAFYPVNLLGGIAMATLRPAEAAEVVPPWVGGYTLPDTVAGPAMAFAAIVLVALFVVMLAASVRRVHDVGRSGWYLAPAFVVVLFLPHVALPPPAYSLWPWVWIAILFLLPGTAAQNRFGPSADPAGLERASAVE